MPWCNYPRIWPYSFVNATVENSIDGGHGALTTARSQWSLDSSFHESQHLTAVSSISISRSISRTLDFLPAGKSDLDPLASLLLSYYLERLCPLTVSSLLSPSPFASLIFPYSVSSASSSAVLEAILALSACHRARLEPTFKDTSLRLAGSVLRRLRHRLRTEDAAQVALDSETLIIMLMLCLFEIVNECDERWVIHLRGARDLIRVRRKVQLTTMGRLSGEDELAIFAERFFAYQDVLGRTACGEEPIFGEDCWASSSSHGSCCSREVIDPWLGCSPELVSILCEITALSRCRAQTDLDGVDNITIAFHIPTASLEARLGTLQQNVPPTYLYAGGGSDDIILQTSAELKRIAASFYLDCALRSAHPLLPESCMAIRQILRLVALLLEGRVTAGLAWPIFVAAVELDPLEDLDLDLAIPRGSTEMPRHGRPFVLYALDRMAAGSSVSNVSQTRTVIERVWQSRDMEALQEVDSTRVPKARQGQNDWERHVAPFCHGLSLG